MSLADGMDILWSDQNPLLPSALAMALYLRAGWATVLLWLLWAALGLFAPRAGLRAHRAVCMGLAVLLAGWVMWPGPASPAYWLGLAFNAPSISSVFLCAGFGWQQWREVGAAGAGGATVKGWSKAFLVLGVVAGYVLLLDTLALLPAQVYAWGFSPVALVCVSVLSVMPCVALNPLQRTNAWTLAMPLGLLLFLLTRLPTGNVWDVVLDPLLWVALHFCLAITVIRERRQR